MRKFAILTFQTLDGVMQAPRAPEGDFSGGFTQGGWAKKCWDEVITVVENGIAVILCNLALPICKIIRVDHTVGRMTQSVVS